MTLALTQLVTDMNTRKFFWGKERLERNADNFTAICDPFV
jgi:hypothetical protein